LHHAGEAEAPPTPTFDHVSGDGIKICLIPYKCLEFQEFLLSREFQGVGSPSARRTMT
jgi:hypothetical protein